MFTPVPSRAGQMDAELGAGSPPGPKSADAITYGVDAAHAHAVLVGDQGMQVIYVYNGTVGDGVALPSLIDASGTVDSPYRGLGAFGQRDAPFFFGRERPVTEVLRQMSLRLAGPSVLVVSGVSGAGKSSLLRAGVLPRLRGSGLPSAPEAKSWPALDFTVTSKPLDALAVRVAHLTGASENAVKRELAADPAGFALTARLAALAGHEYDDEPAPGRRLLVIADQCEQLFALECDEADRHAFLTALWSAASDNGGGTGPAAVVVLAIRADFDARLSDYYPNLYDAVNHRYLVPVMNERELRMAITQPARVLKSSVDEDLVRHLLQENQPDPPADGAPEAAIRAGALPLLSHALDKAWRVRTGPALTLADYDRAGGLQGAVAISAQAAYERLSPAQQRAARQVFVRLVATRDDGVDTAIRVSRLDLNVAKGTGPAADVDAVLHEFSSERLLTMAAGTVEFSHEVLLTAWPLLRDTWLPETRADRIVVTRLAAAAAEWDRHDRDPSYLYSGSLLQAAAEAAERVNPDAKAAERAISLRYRRSRRQLARSLHSTIGAFLRASTRRQRRAGRVRLGAIAVLTALTLLATAIAVYAIGQQHRAETERRLAVRAGKIELSAELAAQSESLDTADPVDAALLAVAAWRVDHTSAARQSLLDVVAQPDDGVLSADAQPLTDVAFSPDGRLLATASNDGTARIWSVATHQQVGTAMTASTGTVTAVAFSPDDKLLATAGTDGTTRIWSVATHQQAGIPMSADRDTVNDVAFSANGQYLATASNDGAARIWSVASHRQVGAAMSADSKPVTSVSFGPGGAFLATASDDGTARIWWVNSHQQAGGQMSADSSPLTAVTFAPGGSYLATAGNDGKARIWKIATKKQVGPAFPTDSTGIRAIAFSPRRQFLVTPSGFGAAQVWSVAAHTPIGGPLGDGFGVVTAAALSPDGQTIATAGADGTTRLWNPETHRQIGIAMNANSHSLPKPSSQGGGIFDTFLQILATVAIAPQTLLGSLFTESLLSSSSQVFSGLASNPLSPAAVGGVAFSPGGTLLATASNDGTARIWSVASHRQIGTSMTADSEYVNSVAFSPHGELLATASNDGTARIWSLASHRQVGPSMSADASPVTAAAFSPDGKYLATASNDGTARIWSLARHRQVGPPMSADASPVTAAAFSPDGKLLATASNDGTARIWSLASHRQVGAALATYAKFTHSLAFSPDGQLLATATDVGTAQLWDVATQQQIGEPLTAQATYIAGVAFSPNGQLLATADDNGAAQIWGVAVPQSLVQTACAIAGRSLTRQQWKTFTQSEPFIRTCP